MVTKHPQGVAERFTASPAQSGGGRTVRLHRSSTRVAALTLLMAALQVAPAPTAIAAKAGGAAGAAAMAASTEVNGTHMEPVARDCFDTEDAVAKGELDAMRGGLSMGGGLLQVSFGIERTVSLNGEIVSRTEMLLSSASARDDAVMATARAGLSDIKLIQNGSGNVMQAALGTSTAGGLVIQNSLNNQHIQSQTVITASVNSMDMLKSLNFQGSLSDALARAVPAR